MRPFWDLKVQPQFGPVQHSVEGPLWLKAWRNAGKALQRRDPALLLTDAAFVDAISCTGIEVRSGLANIIRCS
jgi:hypothetical protein